MKHIIVILGLCFFLIDWLSFGEGGSLIEIGRPRLKGWRNFGCRWTRGVGGLANWTIFLDAICVSSLALLRYKFLTHKQKEGQNFDEFMSQLKKLFSICEFGEL